MYTGNRDSQNFYPIARSLTKLKPNETFNDTHAINEIDPDFFYFKGIDLF